MENIITYLIVSFIDNDEIQIRTWLDCGHYPNAIDYERSRIIIFNMNADVMCGFVKQFHIREWNFGQSAVPPDEYSDLFRHFDSVIRINSETFRYFNMRRKYKPYTTMRGCYDTLASGFMHDGYMAWRNRFYLSKNLLGLSVKTLKPCKYAGKLRGTVAISEFRSTLQESLDVVAEKYGLNLDADAELVIRYWIDYDPYSNQIRRIYLGWMYDTDTHCNLHRIQQRLISVTLYMQEWLRDRGLLRNTTDAVEIQKFLNNSGLVISDFETENPTSYKEKTQEYSEEKYPFICNLICIPFLPWEVPEDFGFDHSLPYAFDRAGNVLLLFNQSHSLPSLLKKINMRSLVRMASYTKDISPQYEMVCRYVNDKIKENLKNVPDPETWFDFATYRVGMSAYYRRKRCYSGTHNIDMNQLINYAK